MKNTNTNRIKNYATGKIVIIRTYSAGVFYGKLVQKNKTEVLLSDARRIRSYKNIGTEISLTGISQFGIHPDSQIETPMSEILVQWIEIIPCSEESIKTFEAQPAAEAS